MTSTKTITKSAARFILWLRCPIPGISMIKIIIIKSITVKYFQLIVDNPSTTNIIRKEINNTQRELTCPTHTPGVLNIISFLKSKFLNETKNNDLKVSYNNKKPSTKKCLILLLKACYSRLCTKSKNQKAKFSQLSNQPHWTKFIIASKILNITTEKNHWINFQISKGLMQWREKIIKCLFFIGPKRRRSL